MVPDCAMATGAAIDSENANTIEAATPWNFNSRERDGGW
jgi:hypothetical protein